MQVVDINVTGKRTALRKYGTNVGMGKQKVSQLQIQLFQSFRLALTKHIFIWLYNALEAFGIDALYKFWFYLLTYKLLKSVYTIMSVLNTHIKI